MNLIFELNPGTNLRKIPDPQIIQEMDTLIETKRFENLFLSNDLYRGI